VNVGGPSGECHLPPVPVPEDVDWHRWLGPAPFRAFSPGLIRGGFRPYRDYSGGGMTDWGCHGFGGCLFAINKHHTGPVKITPPGDDAERLTYTFKDGVKIYHGGGWGGLLSFKGSDGNVSLSDRFTPPTVNIPNYKGSGGMLGDFVHCVKTRERPFRDIEVAHNAATLCHLGNIAYWLGRELQWDPDKEEILNDPEAARWMDRPRREPYNLGSDIQRQVEDKNIRQRAQNIVNERDKVDGYLLAGAWQVSPLYQVKGKDSKGLWAEPLTPKMTGQASSEAPLRKASTMLPATSVPRSAARITPACMCAPLLGRKWTETPNWKSAATTPAAHG